MEKVLEQHGIVTDKGLINEYFEKCLTYGSLFITSDISMKVKIVTELKNVNQGLEEISIVPLDDEHLEFPVGTEVLIVNESNNISFQAKILKNHASKWISVHMPSAIKVVNLRESKRLIPSFHLSPTNWIISYGEDGLTKKSQYEGTVMDISSTGVAFKVKTRRMDGLYRGDKVEMNISESITALARVRGSVVHKTIANISSAQERFIKIGIKFDKNQAIDALIDG